MGGGPYNTLNYGPRVANPDGSINVRCRQCGRVICKVHGPMVPTITHCQVCVLVGQGWTREDALRAVLPHYYQENLTKAPTPIWTPEEEVVALYEEELQGNKAKKWGVLRPLFRVLGWITEEEPAEAKVSTSVARRKRRKGLFEDEEEIAEE